MKRVKRGAAADQPKDETTAVAPPRDVVMIAARDAAGSVVKSLTIPLIEWYEEFHPVIDEGPEVTKQLGIRTIEGREFDTQGRAVKSWTILCNDQGVVEDTYEQEIASEPAASAQPPRRLTEATEPELTIEGCGEWLAALASQDEEGLTATVRSFIGRGTHLPFKTCLSHLVETHAEQVLLDLQRALEQSDEIAAVISDGAGLSQRPHLLPGLTSLATRCERRGCAAALMRAVRAVGWVGCDGAGEFLASLSERSLDVGDWPLLSLSLSGVVRAGRGDSEVLLRRVLSSKALAGVSPEGRARIRMTAAIGLVRLKSDLGSPEVKRLLSRTRARDPLSAVLSVLQTLGPKLPEAIAPLCDLLVSCHSERVPEVLTTLRIVAGIQPPYEPEPKTAEPAEEMIAEQIRYSLTERLLEAQTRVRTALVLASFGDAASIALLVRELAEERHEVKWPVRSVLMSLKSNLATDLPDLMYGRPAPLTKAPSPFNPELLGAQIVAAKIGHAEAELRCLDFLRMTLDWHGAVLRAAVGDGQLPAFGTAKYRSASAMHSYQRASLDALQARTINENGGLLWALLYTSRRDIRFHCVRALLRAPQEHQKRMLKYLANEPSISVRQAADRLKPRLLA